MATLYTNEAGQPLELFSVWHERKGGQLAAGLACRKLDAKASRTGRCMLKSMKFRF